MMEEIAVAIVVALLLEMRVAIHRVNARIKNMPTKREIDAITLRINRLEYPL